MNFFKIIGFVFVITFCNSAYAETGAACTRAGGAIIANALSPSSDGAAIVTDIDGATGSSCKEIPDFYKLQFYKFGLCTANPFTTGTGSTQDFSSCSWLLNSATAVEHIITYSSTGSLATNSEIATGTYNHLVMVLQNRLSQKHTETFNTTIVGRTGSGTTCWTIASTSAFGGADTITGETLISPNPGASNRATLGIDCGSTANPDYTTEIYEAFGEGASFDADIEEDARIIEAFGKQVAMHVAAANPASLGEADLSQEMIEREKSILTEQARESGKPEQVIEKMIQGRMKKFLAEVTLLGQSFVVNPHLTVGEAAQECGVEINGFVRLEVGEGLEKKQEDFAAEVAAQLKG